MELRGPRETALLVAVLVAMSRGVDGAPLWVAAALIVGVAVAGTLHLLAEWRFWRVAPRLALPALAAFASVGAAHLLPVPWLVVAAPASAVAVAWAIAGETPSPAAQSAVHEESAQLTLDDAAIDSVAADTTGSALPGPEPSAPAHLVPEPSAALGIAIRTGSLGLGFLAFAAVGGLVPNGLGGSGTALSGATLVATVALDALIGGLVGYRLTALAGYSGRAAASSTNHYVAIAGHLGALFRVLELPRLVGPALLVAALYGWYELRRSNLRLPRLRRRPIEEPVAAAR